MENRPLFAFERVQIKGYRALANVDVPLSSLNVLIGPNGVGKSSFLDLFQFLAGALGRREPLPKLFTRRGGILRVRTFGSSDPIALTLTCRIPPAPRSAIKGPLSYEVIFDPDPKGFGYLIAREQLCQERGQLNPFAFVSRDDRSGVVFDAAKKKLVPPEPPISPGELLLAQIPRTLTQAEVFRTAFSDIQVHGPIPVHESAPVRRPQTLEPTSLVVVPDGQNLFSVLYQLRQDAPDFYERLLDVLRAGFPGFDRLEFSLTGGGQAILAWHHEAFPNQPFYTNELSSGTLRFLHLVTVLLCPKPQALLCIDEPEDSLHPELIRLLAELLLEASGRTQIVVATQSEALVRHLKPEHVLIADGQNGVCNLTPATALHLDTWLRDYTLDELWRNGHLGGRP